MSPELAAVIVHDLKNALGVLDGELHRMVAEPTRGQAVQAQQTCAALRDKLIGFLTLYRATTQGLAPRIDAVSPQDFLPALAARHAGDRPGVRLMLAAGDLPPLAFFDEHLVGLALEAALQNAVRFARTTVELDCRQDDAGGLVFVIRDDGPGLGTKEAAPSTGIGMALCTAIAEAHRNGERTGSVSLEDGSAQGAVFSLRLP